jgi:hypothetical protein
MDSWDINWAYDCMVNANMSRCDSHLILNRGLIESSGATGLRLRNKDDTFSSDSIDNKGLVHKLTAEQQFISMNLFLTFMANQSIMFGLKALKAWIDSDGWMQNYDGVEYLTSAQITEVRKCLHNASATLLQRHWLQVCRLLLKYITNSDEKPAGDINCLFARDEYQGGAGNLPHIHAIVRVNHDATDPHAVDAFQDRIRGFVGDIIRVEEIDNYVAEGLLRDRDEWYEIQKLAGSILTHRSERNMKQVGTADGDVVMRDNN